MTKENPRGGGNLSLLLGQLYSLLQTQNFTCIFQLLSKYNSQQLNYNLSLVFQSWKTPETFQKTTEQQVANFFSKSGPKLYSTDSLSPAINAELYSLGFVPPNAQSLLLASAGNSLIPLAK